MSLLFLVPIFMLIVGLVSLVSPNARSFSIPMIAIGGSLCLAILLFFLVSYIRARDVRKYLNGNYYAIETTSDNDSYRFVLSKNQFKENDYILLKRKDFDSFRNTTVDKTIVLKVKRIERLYYKNQRDNNFPVDRYSWDSRVIAGGFSPNYVFARFRFYATFTSNRVEFVARVINYQASNSQNKTYGGNVSFYDTKTHSHKTEWRTNGVLLETLDFDKLFDSSNQVLCLNDYQFCEEIIEKPKQPVLNKIASPHYLHPACTVVGVTFDNSSKVYNYLTSFSLSKGDRVVVPTSDGDKNATVCSCKYYSSSEPLPYDYHKLKTIKQKRTAVNHDYDDYYEPDYPDFRQQKEYDEELDRISERMKEAEDNGYYFDEYGVFHDLTDD